MGGRVALVEENARRALVAVSIRAMATPVPTTPMALVAGA
jgi:hypothetical protein